MGESEQEQLPPRVSVLIVSEDNAPALRRCLRALENAAARETFEILVVDNGSQDECPRLDSEFPAVTFLRLPRRFGVVKALNIGMRTAKGELLFFLAPEVEIERQAVVKLAAALDEHEAAAAACPWLLDAEGRPQPRWYRFPEPGTILRIALQGRWDPAPAPPAEFGISPDVFPSLGAFMVRAYFLRALRYIDERYGQSWADAEIAAQLRRASRKILLVPEARAVVHAAELPELRRDPRVRALYSADWALGAARFAWKHYGVLAGIRVRVVLALEAILRALLALLTFRDLRFHLARAGFLLSGQKLDGTQRFL